MSFAPTTKAQLQTAITAWITTGGSTTVGTPTASYNAVTINSWNVSAITDMSSLFANKTTFNSNISGWNVINVTTMQAMFSGTTSFNQPLNAWNVSNVSTMHTMFAGSAYNQPLGSWNVGKVTNMTRMFDWATAFNQPIDSWNVSSVTNMTSLFNGSPFNQSLNSWNVSNVTNMSSIFGETPFNGNITSWDVSKVTNMSNMFKLAPNFNQPIGSWNVGNATTMSNMFIGATQFNQDISNWNVSRVTIMTSMFQNASAFNRNIRKWYVGSVTAFTTMFSGATQMQQQQGATDTPTAAYFNQPVANTLPVGKPTISGLVKEGQTLAASITGITDTDTILSTFSYQWYSNNIVIVGATSSTYLLAPADVDKTITVIVNYLDGRGTTEYITSDATTPVIPLNARPVGDAIITGPAVQGYVLTASHTLSDADGPVLLTVTYNWFRCPTTDVTYSPLLIATGSTYPLIQADVGSYISVTASYTDSLSKLESKQSAATAIIAPAPIVTISGTATQREFLTAETTGITDVGSPGAFSYQWKRSSTVGVAGSNILVDATGSTYTLIQDDVNKYITVTVSYTDVLEQNKNITSVATSAVTNVNDIATGWPVITGTATQGKVLTADTTGIGDVDGLGTFEYTWLRKSTGAGQSYSSIPGAINATYKLTPDDVSKYIMVTVKFTDGGGSNEVRPSAATPAVAPFVSLPTATRAQLDAAVTAWCSDSIAATDVYGPISSWDVSAITDMSTLFVAKTTFNSDISAWNVSNVTNMQSMFDTALAFNQPLNAWNVSNVTNMESLFRDNNVFNQPLNTWNVSRVTNMRGMFRGAYVFNQNISTWNVSIVTDMVGMFTNARAFNWNIRGWYVGQATLRTDMFLGADAMLATPDTIATPPYTYFTQAPVANTPPTGSVTIAGPAVQGYVLTASHSLVDANGPALLTVTYNWFRCPTTDVTYSPLLIATGSTYPLIQADVGSYISVTASYTDSLSQLESKQSAATAIIAPAPIVTISGTATQRDSLTAVTTGITDKGSPGAFSYQWKRSSTVGVAGSNILLDATGSTYTLIQDDVNKYITVTVSYTDVLEQNKNITSVATSAVTNVNDIATGWPVITGTATQGKVLTADTTGIGDVDGLGTFEYTWLRKSTGAGQSYSSIPGAINATYKLTPDDVSKYIMVTVKFTDGGGSNEVRPSAATPAVAPFVPLPTATRAQLDAAVTAWCSDSIAATDVYGPISSWDVSAITDMSTLFVAKTTFNSDISAWNVSNVTNMQSMFDTALAFNQPLNAWNVSNVTNMESLFRDNNVFNQPLNTWNVSRVTNMRGMFRGAYVFNQNISTWNVSIVTDMVGMFLNARAFNWNIRGWYVGQATLRTDMFLGADAMLATPDTIATPPYTYFTQAPVANTPPTSSVTIEGTAKQNEILTAKHTLVDANGPALLTVLYQWKRSLSATVAGSNISLNATSSTYTLVPDDVGKYITVTVSYTDSLTNAESVTSGSTEAVGPFVPLLTTPTESVNKSCDFVLPALNASFELLQALSIVGNYDVPAPFALPTITLPMSASLFNDGLFHLELVDSNIHTLLNSATEAVYFSEKITYYADDAKFPELKSNGNKYLRELPVMNGSASASTHLRQRNADVDGLAASMVHELAYQLTGISLMDDQLANGVSLRTVIDNYITTALPAALKSKLAACNGKTQNVSGASDMTDQRNVPRELFMQIVESVVGDRHGTHLAKSSRLNTLFHSSNFAGGKYGIKFIAGDTLRFTVTISPSANHVDYIVDGIPHAPQEARAVEVIISMM